MLLQQGFIQSNAHEFLTDEKPEHTNIVMSRYLSHKKILQYP